jgi:hypothetical protein
MAQYRKRFLHHCIDGPLLLGLSDKHLKAELLVGPLGHRVAIMEGIMGLAAAGDCPLARSPANGAGAEEWDDGYVYEDTSAAGEWEGREVVGWNGTHGSRSRSPSPGGRQRPGSAPEGPRRPASALTPVSAAGVRHVVLHLLRLVYEAWRCLGRPYAAGAVLQQRAAALFASTV